MLIPLFPLESGLFPGGLISLRIFEVRYLNMIKQVIKEKSSFGVVMLSKGDEVRKPGVSEELMRVGTIAKISEINTLQPALILIRCVGQTRFRLTDCFRGKYGLWSGNIELIDDDKVAEIPKSLESIANALGKIIFSMQKSGVPQDQMPILPPFRLDECGWVANRWAELLSLNLELKQSLLEENCPNNRLEKISKVLTNSGGNFEC